ncbi:MAG: serine/threonine protein kinase [Stenomitos rutilans HA7619-LM2]|jgi:serine/threonine-protein kinase|nr:serine/threonine protein kinase [Stenomitos rutilans HA7619-LM2]
MHPSIVPGTLLQNRYCLIGAAGQSKFGQTYLARDQKRLNELCVVKEFTPVVQEPAAIEDLRQRFHQEILGLYELQHPQLPRLRMVFAQENRLYWVRDYVEGKSYGVLLDERKAQGEVFSEAEVLQLLLKVLPVLTYLHNRGMVHRNLSLDTLILRQQDQVPVLINFGLVQELVAQLQLHPIDQREVLGQWGFAPPEQFHGKAEPGSDLYALAVTAIVLLTGKMPESLYNSQTQRLDWESLVTVHPNFMRLLRQMLQLQPQKRPTSAAQVSKILEPLLPTAAVSTLSDHTAPAYDAPVETSVNPAVSSPATGAPTDAPSMHLPRTPKRRKKTKRRSDSDPRASAAMVVGLVMLIAAVAWKFLPHNQPQAKPNTSPTTQPAVTAASPSSLPKAPSPSISASPSSPSSQRDSVSEEALRDRRRDLNIKFEFFTSLVDEVFYGKYPQLRSRKLGDSEQDKFKREWNAIASNAMDKLATLKPETRAKMGSYRRVNYDEWLKVLGEAGTKSSPRLDALADSRFFQLFPDQKGKPLNPRTFGQVWYAIADEQLSTAKAQPRPASGSDTNSNRSL